MMQWTQLSSTETWILMLTGFFIWLSYTIHVIKKKSSGEAFVRSGFFFLALIFLCLLIFKPMIQVKKIKGTAILLTEDADVVPDSLPVFALTSVKQNENFIKVPDLSYIERNHPEISNLYIKGYNLPPNQLKQIQNLKVQFLKQDMEGFTWLSYNRHLIEGDKLKVAGTYKNNSADSIKLNLIAASGIIDSTFIPPNKKHPFLMQGNIEFQGKYLGYIEIIKKDDVVRELLPYTITAAKPINIVILQAFPSFEMNALKEWLAEQQHKVQVNVQISRDNYATQYINQKAKDESNLLSEENLNEVDILITDAERVRRLRNFEKKALQKGVNQGLGVLVYADEKTVRNPEVLDENFQIVSSASDFMFKDEIKNKNWKLKKLPVSIKETIEVVPVLNNENQNIPVAYIPSGRGKIGLQLITETYPLVLQGEKVLYHSYWSEIINALSRREKIVELQINDLPFIWEKEMVQLHINDTTIKKIEFSDERERGQNLFPKIGLMNPFSASFKFLPVRSRWYKIKINPENEIHEYILANGAWDGLKKVLWQRKINEYEIDQSAFKKEEYKAFKEIPIFWWYIGFIFSIGTLWWREKVK